MNVQELATIASKSFTTKQRDEETIVVHQEDAEQWVKDMCQEAHAGMFPDDFRYRFIWEAVEAIADTDECADLNDVAHEFADSVSVYTNELYEWLTSHSARGGYIDEAVAEMGHGDSITDDIMRGQYQERLEVFGLVLQALQDQAEQ